MNITTYCDSALVRQASYPSDFGCRGTPGKSSWDIGGQAPGLAMAESWFDGTLIQVGRLHRPCTLTVETDRPFYVGRFCLSGECRCSSADATGSITLEASYSAFMYVPPGRSAYAFCGATVVLWLRITPDHFTRLTGGGIAETGPVPVTAQVRQILDALANRASALPFERILLESKVLELLALTLGNPNGAPRSTLREHDRARIEFAKQLIGRNIREPYSLIELARHAGLNDFKLKKGFKALVGTTVFGYLADLRMEKAMLLLRDEKKPVNLVAHEVGYRNPHHFTAAFKRRYGVLPSRLNGG